MIILNFNFHSDPSRKLFKVQATTLQENEEKVAVEESFQPKSFPAGEGNRTHGEAPEGSSSSDIERWVIKLEQSINILLTVNS